MRTLKSCMAFALMWGSLGLGDGLVAKVLAQPSETSATEMVQLEREFFRKVEEESEARYRSIVQNLPEAERSIFKAAIRAGISKFRELFDFGTFVAKYGKVATLTYVVTWTVDHAVLSALLAMGEPMLAGIVYAIPHGSSATALAVWFKSMSEDRRLAKELGGVSLRKLQKMRDDLLGYKRTDRILSLMVREQEAAIQAALPVDLVRRMKPRGQAEEKAALSIQEMESWLKTSKKGRIFLDEIVTHRPNRTLYSMLLLRYIGDDPELYSRLQDLIRKRAIARVTSFPDARLALNELDDQEKELQALSRRVQKMADNPISLIKGRMTGLSPARQERNELVNVARDELQKLFYDLKKAEYSFLMKLQSGDSEAERPLSEEIQRVRAQVQVLEPRVAEQERIFNCASLFQKLRSGFSVIKP